MTLKSYTVWIMTTLEYIFTFNVTHKVNSVFFVTSHNILTEAIIIYFVCNHWLLERNLNENIVLALNYQTIHPEYILCAIWRANSWSPSWSVVEVTKKWPVAKPRPWFCLGSLFGHNWMFVPVTVRWKCVMYLCTFELNVENAQTP